MGVPEAFSPAFYAMMAPCKKQILPPLFFFPLLLLLCRKVISGDLMRIPYGKKGNTHLKPLVLKYKAGQWSVFQAGTPGYGARLLNQCICEKNNSFSCHYFAFIKELQFSIKY